MQKLLIIFLTLSSATFAMEAPIPVRTKRADTAGIMTAETILAKIKNQHGEKVSTKDAILHSLEFLSQQNEDRYYKFGKKWKKILRANGQSIEHCKDEKSRNILHGAFRNNLTRLVVIIHLLTKDNDEGNRLKSAADKMNSTPFVVGIKHQAVTAVDSFLQHERPDICVALLRENMEIASHANTNQYIHGDSSISKVLTPYLAAVNKLDGYDINFIESTQNAFVSNSIFIKPKLYLTRNGWRALTGKAFNEKKPLGILVSNQGNQDFTMDSIKDMTKRAGNLDIIQTSVKKTDKDKDKPGCTIF